MFTIRAEGRARRWLALSTLVIVVTQFAATCGSADEEPETTRPTLTVKSCDDFDVTGRGDHAAWSLTEWTPLHRRGNGPHDYSGRFKMLYSNSGVYVLFDGTDQRLTATLEEDFLFLWTEDVFECFFWPDEQHPLYFEYEISPLGYELPILVPNMEGRFMGWLPWSYTGKRRIQKKVSATGGANVSMSEVTGWRAEVFIPYELLKPLNSVPPQPGTRWRANFYRMDYDQKQPAQQQPGEQPADPQPVTEWDWSRVGSTFHDIKNFGTLVFE